MKPGACTCLAAVMAVAACLFSGPLLAYEWMTNKQIRNRTLDIAWELNPRQCPAAAERTLKQVSSLLDFYTLTGFDVGFRQLTDLGNAVDGRYVVQCRPVLDYMDMGYSFRSGGVTLIARSHDLITDADIILNADRLSFAIALHEFTHMLGLDHSDAPNSVVCHSDKAGHCRGKARLDADDLVGLADLYDVPANCTPYMDEELTIYFPYIGGWWAELKPMDATDPYKGFYPSATGRSLDYDWECKLRHSKGFQEVETDIYHQGELVETVFTREGDRWFVNFPDSETRAAGEPAP